jgi:ParB-like chromosome segregation protein Spo0J
VFKRVSVHQLKPNPFRRLDEYPIIREKVDALKESIAQTGFWGTIVGRPKGPDIEIAFGHHRLVALQEAGVDAVEVIIRDLSNEDMLRMMARENMEEWGTSAWVEIETIRATIDAFGKGEIELPLVSKNTPDKREVGQNTGLVYTMASVAYFLGWTRKHSGGTLRPNYACETAFRAIDTIDAGFIAEADIRGLKRSHLAELVAQQWSIFQAEMRAAKDNQKKADEAKKKAAMVAAPVERKRLETQAVIHEEQAAQHKAAAKEKATTFGREAASMFRGDSGLREVRQKAESLKPTVERPIPILDIDGLSYRIANQLEKIADGNDMLSKDFAVLKSALSDLSPRAADALSQSFVELIRRLNKMNSVLSRSHTDGTGSNHARKAIAGS